MNMDKLIREWMWLHRRHLNKSADNRRYRMVRALQEMGYSKAEAEAEVDSVIARFCEINENLNI